MSAYIKSYDGEMMNCWKNIMIFRTKLVIVLKITWLRNHLHNKKFLKTKLRSYSNELQIFILEKYLKQTENLLYNG